MPLWNTTDLVWTPSPALVRRVTTGCGPHPVLGWVGPAVEQQKYQIASRTSVQGSVGVGVDKKSRSWPPFL